MRYLNINNVKGRNAALDSLYATLHLGIIPEMAPQLIAPISGNCTEDSNVSDPQIAGKSSTRPICLLSAAAMAPPRNPR